MAISTYTELKTAIGSWSDRADLAATSVFDEFILLTENHFKLAPKRAVDPGIGGIRTNITRATGTLSAGTATLARPSDFLEGYRFILTADSGGLLEYIGPEQLRLKFRTGSGQPRYWTVSDVIEFDVVPDSAYAYQLSYYPSVTGLSGSNASNWILANYPTVYLSGCMFELCGYTKDANEASNWMTRYKALCEGINKTYERSRYSQGPIAAKVG